MGWRFRKSFSPLPGVRINFSPRGISTSVGFGPARIYLGPRGAALTARIPGSGASFRQSLGSAPESAAPSSSSLPRREAPFSPSTIAPLPIGEIRSGSTALLTTDGLQPLKELLTKAQGERLTLLPDLAASRTEASKAASRYKSWKEGWLLRRLFKKRLAKLEHWADDRRNARQAV